VEQEKNNTIDFNLNELKNNTAFAVEVCEVNKVPVIDTQVPVGSLTKRKFSAQYKLKIINEFDAYSTVLERGALLRREGLYASLIPSWRRQLGTESDGKKGAAKTQRIDHLMAEIDQMKKKLAQAQAVIDLQKKVSELLGTYILPHESNGVKS